jgi:hypothetical protein
MATIRVPHSAYFRHRLYGRIRHSRVLKPFITTTASRLSASASGHTVSPKHASQLGPEVTITVGGQPTTTKILTIDGKTYTFKSALTEVKAAGTLTNDGSNVTNADTITIGSKVYTFQDTLTNVDGHVKIGANNTATMTNLFHAINASGGSVGTDYATLTVANTQVTATNPTGTTVVLTAITAGTAGNAIATTEASTHLSFGAATLTGGVASVANEVLIDDTATHTIDNLANAITGGSGSGTKYALATVTHTGVTASEVAGNLLVQSLKTRGARGSAMSLSTNDSNLTVGAEAGPNWTATSHGLTEGEGPLLITNSGGALPTLTPTTGLYVHVVDANTVAFATSRAAIEARDFIATSTAGTGTQTAKRGADGTSILGLLTRNKPRTIAAASDIDSLA